MSKCVKETWHIWIIPPNTCDYIREKIKLELINFSMLLLF